MVRITLFVRDKEVKILQSLVNTSMHHKQWDMLPGEISELLYR